MTTEIGRGVIPVTLDANTVGSSLSSLNALVRTKLGAIGLVGGTALAAGIGGAIAGTAGLLKVGGTFVDMRNTIVKATGASGKALKDLEKSALNVGKVSPAAFNDIATAIAGVNQRLGLTGKPLEDVTRKILTLSRLTGTDLKTNIAAMTRLFGDWSIPTEKQAGTLDKLYRASQLTGIGVDRLSQLMVQFGSPLRQLGLSFDFTTSMFSRFEREGVNIQTAMPGLRMALKNFAKDGKEPAPALMKTFKAIKQTSSVAEANTMAFEVFGTRAGPDLAAAIREGRFELGPLMKELRNSEGTLDKAGRGVRTFSSRWELIKHNILIPLRPLAIALFDALTRGSQVLATGIGPAIAKVQKAIRPLVTNLKAAFVDTVLPALKEVGVAVRDDLLPTIKKIMPVVGPVAGFIVRLLAGAVLGAIKGVIQAFKGIVNVIVGVVRLVKAIFTGDWAAAWDALKQIVGGVLDAIIGIFKVWWNLGILAIFKKGVLALLKGWKGLWTGLGKAASKAWTWITGLFKSALGLVAKILIGAVKGYVRFWTGLFKWLVNVAVHGWKVLRSAFGGALAAIRTVFTEVMLAIRTKFSQAWTYLKGIGDKMITFFKTTITGAFGKAKDGIIAFWNAIKSAAMKPVRFVVDTVWNNGLRKVINLIPGVSDVGAVHFAAGGPVRGGRRGKDSVPSMLMPGEHVWTTEEVAKAGGHRAMLALRRLAQKGMLDKVGDIGAPGFASGGSLSASQILRAQAFAASQTGKPYKWGGVGPGGYDCSGFMSAITNVLRGIYPHNRVGATSSFPWSGFLPGPGQFTIGSSRSYAGGIGHMAGTLAGMNVESAGGVGVRVGSAARGAHSGFDQVAHLGRGGVFKGSAAVSVSLLEQVKDIFGKVSGWLSELASMGGWGGLLKSMVSSVVGGVKDFVFDKIPGAKSAAKAIGWAADLFDGGGILKSGRIGMNASGRPERILSPAQTIAFERLVDVLAPTLSARAMTTATEQLVGELRITNWEKGTGYFRLIAQDEISATSEFDGSVRRMG